MALIIKPCASAYPTKTPSFSNTPNVRSTSVNPPSLRRSSGSVSFKPNKTAKNISAPITANTPNTPRHDITVSSCPPATGAKMGAKPFTSISIEKNFVKSEPENKSRTLALEITIPAAPAIP